jgi:NTE family protein
VLRALTNSAGTADLESFDSLVVKPMRNIACRTIDVKSIAVGILLPGFMISDRVAAAYDSYLFGGRKLADLPDDTKDGVPHFVLNATNVQTGSLWRFARRYMADWQVGLWNNPDLRIAVAVAASSAFPPVLSPCVLNLDHLPDPSPNADWPAPKYGVPPYTTHVVLSDGGVYDNLGLETAFKRFKTILVSDGGMKMAADPEPHEDWALHSKRILELVDNQVRSLRKRQLIGAYVNQDRSGTYWGIASHLQDNTTRSRRLRPSDCRMRIPSESADSLSCERRQMGQ